jgi:hypothetical protein
MFTIAAQNLLSASIVVDSKMHVYSSIASVGESYAKIRRGAMYF